MLDSLIRLFTDPGPASFVNFKFLPKYAFYFIQGVEYTLLLSLVAVLLAIIPALLLALMRLSKNRFVHGLSGAYIAVFRSTPLLVQLSIIFFGVFGTLIKIPRIQVFGFIDLSYFIPGVIALALNSSAYVAEIFRAGILAVDAGQTEAARSLGSVPVAGHASGGTAPGHQKHPARPGQRGHHHGEGILHLYGPGYAGADVGRQDRGFLHLYFHRPLRPGRCDLFLHQLPRQQGH